MLKTSYLCLNNSNYYVLSSMLTFTVHQFYVRWYILQVAQWLERSTEMLKIAGSIAQRAGDFSVAI